MPPQLLPTFPDLRLHAVPQALIRLGPSRAYAFSAELALAGCLDSHQVLLAFPIVECALGKFLLVDHAPHLDLVPRDETAARLPELRLSASGPYYAPSVGFLIHTLVH